MTDLWAVDPAMVVSWTAWFVIAVTIHELAHGFTAVRQGDMTPYETGHMTWNPIVHMGWMSLIMFAVIGIGWGAMPVSPQRFRSRYGDAIVSVAGPLSNLGLALISAVLGGLWIAYGSGFEEPFRTNLVTFFYVGVGLNLILAAFNMLPVPPLDGSHILANFSADYRRLIEHPNVAIGSLMVLFLIFFVLPIDTFGWAWHTANMTLDTVASWLP